MIRCLLVEDIDNPSIKRCTREGCGREIINNKWPASKIHLKCNGIEQPKEQDSQTDFLKELRPVKLTQEQEQLAKEYHTPKNMKERATSFFGAIKNFVSDGLEMVSKEEYKDRLSICEVCPKRIGGACSVCTCNLKAKAAMKSQHCPIKKWPGDIKPLPIVENK